MYKWIMFCLVVLLLVPVTAQEAAQEAAQDEVRQIGDEFITEMEAVIEEANDKYVIPGSAVAFVQNGEIVYSGGFGVRNVETGEPVTPETLFRPGSTLKSATAMLIATLVDDGLMTWETPVSELLPGLTFPTDELTTEATIGEIMGHGTGLQTAIVPYYWNLVSPQEIITAQATAPIIGERGASYAYNNELYAIAGYAAAAATGAESDYAAVYADLMQERIFDPSGMDTYVLGNDPTAFSDNAAASYTINLIRGLEVPDPTGGYLPVDAIVPAGGGVGSVMDMANYLITQLNNGVAPDGTRVVSEENLLRTRAVQNTVTDETFNYPDFVTYRGYGMGWVTLDIAGVEVLWHNGGIDGFLTDMVIIPQADTGMVIMSNSLTAFATNLWVVFEFIDRLYDLNLTDIEGEIDALIALQTEGIDMLEPLLANPTVDREAVAPLLGEYTDGWTVRVDDEDILRIERPGLSAALLPIPMGSNVYIIASGEVGLQVTFEVDENAVATMTITAPQGEISATQVE